MNDAAPRPQLNQGLPEPRIDARLKVTGEARYAADVPVHNLAYAVLVTSTIARGSVKTLDLGAARNAPGVLDVVSYDEIGDLRKPSYTDQSYTSLGPLHSREIMHDGQIIAVIVAESFQAAEAAARKVKVEYDTRTPSAELDSPGTETVPAAPDERHEEDPQHGDFTAEFRSSPVTFEAEYRTPTQTHNPIELFSTTAVWTDGQLTVYEPSQFVYGFRAELARELSMDPGDVRVVSDYVGGGFGSKGPITPRTALIAVAARRLNRPVRCVVSRGQGYTTQPYRAPTRHRIRLGATRAGRITAFSHEAWELTSRVDNYVVGGTETTARLYGYSAVSSKVNLVKADRQTPAYMRSPPELPYMFALESAVDELAWQLKMDPVELRRLNDTQTDPVDGKPFSSRHLMECFDRAAEAFGWRTRDPAIGSMRDGNWLVGLGCATAVYPTNVAAAAARVRLLPNGSVRVQCAAQEIGTGIRTVAGQMAADQLGTDFSTVRVEMGDTNLPPGPASGGSKATASVCSAVLLACEKVRRYLFETAANLPNGPFNGRGPTGLFIRDAAVMSPDGARLSLRELFDRSGIGVIEEYAEFKPDGAPSNAIQQLYDGKGATVGGAKRKRAMYAFGAEFVEVRIHARTREIRVPRLVGAFAAGRIMNTRTARSQLMGGLIWGMGSALHESTEMDRRTARTVNRDLQDYLVPVNADVGDVEVIMLPEIDNEVNPAGVKGIGELGNVGTNAAVANAVFHATGKRIRQLPIRLESLV